MVQEFYSNILSNFPESGGLVYVHGVIVAFDPSVICTILYLDLSFASVSSKYNVATSQYHLNAYQYDAYVDPYIPLFNDQVSKSHLKPFNRIWSNFICRNVLGTSNNDNPTLDSGDPRPFPPPNASQDSKIAYLEFETNFLRKQFVDFTSLVSQSASSPPMATIYAVKGNGVSINVHPHFSSTHTSKGKHIRFTYSSNEDEDAEGLCHGPCPEDVPVEDAIPARSPDNSNDSSKLEEF
ncbi:hypothetical protein C1H46_037898 [Malus baccata]|uniref:Uncharacterized protein n=1 Tax=Malus baccata TaxID=106549 RepID=A0A540KQT0_MALBA|nr:hypothetical protein C1H46_037898 [Malus baccata]